MLIMGKIAIIRITVVDSAGQKTSHNGQVIIEKSDLEDYRRNIKNAGIGIDHVLLTYEEIEDD